MHTTAPPPNTLQDKEGKQEKKEREVKVSRTQETNPGIGLTLVILFEKWTNIRLVKTGNHMIISKFE